MIRELGNALRLPAAPAAKQNGAHRRALAEAVGCHRAVDELHRIVDGHAGGYRASRRVDVQMHVGLGVVRLEKEHLGDHGVGDLVVDGRAEKDDAVFQQPAVDIHRPLFAAALFDHIGNQRHGKSRFWLGGYRMAASPCFLRPLPRPFASRGCRRRRRTPWLPRRSCSNRGRCPSQSGRSAGRCGWPGCR